MQRLLWILVFIVLPNLASAYYETGRELMRNCESSEAPRWALCRGYLTGIADSIDTARAEYTEDADHPFFPTFTNVCRPDDVTRGKLVKTWIEWANRHPEMLRRPAVDLVVMAFTEAWPCD